MPAVSKEQQKAMCMALAARRGDLKVKDLKGAALEIYKSDMTDEQIEDFTILKEGFIKISKYIIEGKTMKSITEKIKESLNEGYSGEWTWDDEADKDGKLEATIKDFHHGGRSESSVTWELTLDHEDDDYYYYVKAVPKKMVAVREVTVKHFGNTASMGKRIDHSRPVPTAEEEERSRKVMAKELDIDEGLLK